MNVRKCSREFDCALWKSIIFKCKQIDILCLAFLTAVFNKLHNNIVIYFNGLLSIKDVREDIDVLK